MRRKIFKKIEVDELDDADSVDFSRATIYLVGLQTVASTVAISIVSVVACWSSLGSGASANRTLAICCILAAAAMRKPIFIRPAHGVRHLFSCLQPCAGVYIGSLVVDQLKHTCTRETDTSPSWTSVLFFFASLTMLVSGFMRARVPLSNTDIPFLVTLSALVVVAVLPPPAIALAGPLCEKVSLWNAAERVLRSFFFSALVTVHVYAATQGSGSLVKTTATRAVAAALWTLGVHPALLPLAILQFGLVVYARITDVAGGCYNQLPSEPHMGAVNNSPNGHAIEVAEVDHKNALEEQDKLLSHEAQMEALKEVPDSGESGPRKWVEFPSKPSARWTTERLAEFASRIEDV